MVAQGNYQTIVSVWELSNLKVVVVINKKFIETVTKTLSRHYISNVFIYIMAHSRTIVIDVHWKNNSGIFFILFDHSKQIVCIYFAH